MLTINSRLLDPITEMDITENFNRILSLIDSMQTDINSLAGRVEALEGTGNE